MVPSLTAQRYETPLREGGSLPAIVEASDGHRYVMKFRGAGQGHRALIAEIIGGEMARAAGLPVPEFGLLQLAEGFGRREPDPEIQDLLAASSGVNFGIRYLPGSLGYDPAALEPPDPQLAAQIVWFDAYITNVDRTPRNPNLLWWRERLYLIDHGAALFFHHRWDGWLESASTPFPQIADHVLLPVAGDLSAADRVMSERLTHAVIADVVAAIPAAWLGDVEAFASVAAHREAYRTYLESRLRDRAAFVAAAEAARRKGLAARPASDAG